MNSKNKLITQTLFKLSEQHANTGNIDATTVHSLCDLISNQTEDEPVDVNIKILRQLIVLQAHIISDLQLRIGENPYSNQIEQTKAINDLLRTYIA